ncbi:MAG TPA: hypothetical protein VMT17_13665 [Anaeromyxobacteraceae bacterium]|nr:hypothetical protein [Anaeromyxobacteraceae bacterium]
MKFARTLALAAPLGFLVACGTSSSDQTAAAHVTTAQLAAATPSIANVSFVDSAQDNASPTATPPAMGGGDDFQGHCDADPCNPHLFLRSEEVVDRVNRHFYKFLQHVEAAIVAYPAHTTDDSASWKVRHLGVEAILTVTSPSTSVYNWTLDLVPLSNPAGTTEVAYGTVDQRQAAGPHQGIGDMTLMLNALASVSPSPLAEVAGTLLTHYEVFSDRKLIALDAQDVVWDTDSRNPWRSTPRSAYYTNYRVKGAGGSLKVQEESGVPTYCQTQIVTPQTSGEGSSATLVPAQVDLVNRWYIAAPSTSTSWPSIHGRTDAQLTGPLPSPIASVQALTCHQSPDTWETPVEGAWMIKAEDSSGATLWGREFIVGNPPCDPALADPNASDPSKIPSLDGSANDFQFGKVDFASWQTPYSSFPGYIPP